MLKCDNGDNTAGGGEDDNENRHQTTEINSTANCCDDAQVEEIKEPNRTLYILMARDVLVSAVYLQHQGNTTYISFVDSTGFYRGHTRLFLKEIIRRIGGLIVVFSHPMDAPIFGRSERNSLKSQKTPFKLFKFWKGILQERCRSCCNSTANDEASAAVAADSTTRGRSGCTIKNGGNSVFRSKYDGKCFLMGWSAFESARDFPYKEISGIERFEDDPKSKMAENFASKTGNFKKTKEFFTGLLFRKDFATGGLLFSYCPANNEGKIRLGAPDEVGDGCNAADGRNTVDNSKDNCPTLLDGCREDAVKKRFKRARKAKISEIISLLRSLDFSTKENAQESTRDFLKRTNFEFSSFYSWSYQAQ